FLLLEAPFEVFAVAPPPGAVEFLGHHFEDDDVVAAGAFRSLAAPDALGGGAGERGQPAKAPGQLLADAQPFRVGDRLAGIVGDRQENLDEIHRGSLTQTGRFRARSPYRARISDFGLRLPPTVYHLSVAPAACFKWRSAMSNR